MNRQKAILNATMVMHYLATFETKSYITLDVNHYSINVHYFDSTKTNAEIEEIAKKLETIIVTGTRIEFRLDETLNTQTFNVIWEI